MDIVKNKEYEIDILRLGINGEGIGKIEDLTVFVVGALPDERVNIRIIKIAKRYAIGKLLNLNKKSPNRIQAKCDIYDKCGGCSLMHLDYKHQLIYKRDKVFDNLERIGKLDLSTINMHETLGMEEPYNYRNKVILPVSGVKGNAVLGFYGTKSHNVVPVSNCNIQFQEGDIILETVKKWMNKYSIPPYNEINHSGLIRNLMIRKGFTTGEIMVVLVSMKNNVPYLDELIRDLKEKINLTCFFVNVNNKKTNVALGDKTNLIYGNSYIYDNIGDLKFKISPKSFFQVNPIETKVLYNKALEFADLKGSDTVFDAYCGAGTISLFLAKCAKKVIGVEIVKEAIEDAKENAKLNNIENAEFICGEAEVVIPDLIDKGIYADVVVVDPPRKGCEKSLLESIANMKPEKIVYVSCDSATLARDLNILNSLGYKTKEVQPVDMFPQTAHVECVVFLRR